MKQSSVRARIRQLCCLGVPGELLMVPLLPTVRELISSDSAGFFWVDERGEVRNLYAERLPPPELAAGSNGPCKDAYQSSLRASFLACADAPDNVAAQSAFITGDFHILSAVARLDAGAVGQVRLYRAGGSKPFGEEERADLASVMHYIARGAAAPVGRLPEDQLAFAYEDSEEEAMIVTDASGTIQFASDNGLRLLLLATVSEITPAALGSTISDGAVRAIKVLCGRLEAMGRGFERVAPVITLDSRWGRFVLRGYRLSNRSRGEARIGVRIQHQVPMILRFVEAMGRQALSPQQREIALQIALGRSNQEMSERLGVSLNTIAYHVKQLFLRLDVHTRTEAVEKIAWGDVGSRHTPEYPSGKRRDPVLKPQPRFV